MSSKQIDTMPFHGFDTKVYTLMVGPDGKRLNVQDDVLTRIPMFKDAVKTGKIKQDVPFSIVDCDPKAVATVLAFVRDGRLPDILGDTQKSGKVAGVKRQLSNLIMAYQLALKFDLEAAQNALLDRTYPLLESMSKAQLRPNPNLSEKFRDSKMYLLMSRQFAYQLQEEARQRSDPLYSQLEIQELAHSLDSWQKKDVIALMTHLLRPMEDCPIEAAVSNPCLYHVHKKNKWCGGAPVGEVKDVKSLSCEDAMTTVKATKTAKTKKNKNKSKTKAEDEELQPFSSIEEERLQSRDKLPNQPRSQGEPSSLQDAKLDKQKPEARGKPKHLTNWRTESDHDGSNSESRYASVNAKTSTKSSPEIWSDCDGEDIESQSTVMDILTPTSSTASAVSAATLISKSARTTKRASGPDLQKEITIPDRSQEEADWLSRLLSSRRYIPSTRYIRPGMPSNPIASPEAVYDPQPQEDALREDWW